MMQACSYFRREYKENQRACRDIDRASHVFPVCSQSSDLSQQNTTFTWFVEAKWFNDMVKMMQACSYFHREYRENQRACRDIDRASHVFPFCSQSSDLSQQKEHNIYMVCGGQMVQLHGENDASLLLLSQTIQRKSEGMQRHRPSKSCIFTLLTK